MSIDRSDKELIDDYLAGDASSFNTLYERYRRPLYSYLNKMMPGQGATIDDLFQRTWIKAIKNMPRYQDQQTFYAWIVRIAHNSAVDHFRRESKRQASDIEGMQVADDTGAAPFDQIEQQELAKAVQDTIDTLPPEQKQVVLLRRQGVPFKEIADLQETSVNTVLGRMHYAVAKMKERLKEN